MRRALIINFILLNTTVYFGCQKSDIISYDSPDKSDLNVIWQSELVDQSRSGQLSGLMMKPVIYNGTVVSSYYQRLSDDAEDIFGINKSNGDTLWKWSDHISSQNGERNLGVVDRPVHMNYMHYSTEEANYVINLEDGSTVWNERSGNYYDITREGYIGRSVFQPRQYGTPAGDSNFLYKIDIRTGSRDVVSSNKEVNGLYPTLKTPVAWEYNGDTLIAFYTTFITYSGPVDGRNDSISLTCINTSEDSTLWTLENYDPESWGNSQGPKIHEGRLYLAGRYTIYCLDPYTGEIIWSHRDQSFGSLHTADIVFNDRGLYYKSGDGYVKSLDKITGRVRWDERDSDIVGGSSMRMTIYEDKLIFSDSRLIVLDATYGTLIAKVESPNDSPEYPSTRFSHITVDPETGLAYAGDGYFLMCFEVPGK